MTRNEMRRLSMQLHLEAVKEAASFHVPMAKVEIPAVAPVVIPEVIVPIVKEEPKVVVVKEPKVKKVKVKKPTSTPKERLEAFKVLFGKKPVIPEPIILEQGFTFQEFDKAMESTAPVVITTKPAEKKWLVKEPVVTQSEVMAAIEEGAQEIIDEISTTLAEPVVEVVAAEPVVNPTYPKVCLEGKAPVIDSMYIQKPKSKKIRAGFTTKTIAGDVILPVD